MPDKCCELNEGDWWDYCFLVGYTVNKVVCVDECVRYGRQSYWSCFTSKEDTFLWGKCSPPGKVKPVHTPAFSKISTPKIGIVETNVFKK